MIHDNLETTSKTAAALAAAFLVLLSFTWASQASANTDLRLQVIESRINAVEKRLYDGVPPASGEAGGSTANNAAFNQLQAEMQQLQRDVRELRGEIERLDHENKQIKDSQKKLYLDLDGRIQALEKRPVAAAPAGPAYAPGNTPAPQPASEQDDYLAAFELLKQGQYGKAAKAYEQFLATYPNGQYADNAQYWLGESRYVNKEYPKAMVEFQRLTINYPDSDKIPGAKLKMGYIHYQLKEYEQARLVLGDVIRNYPESSAAGLAKERLDRMDREGV